MDGFFYLDTVEMSSPNGPATSISPEERAELNDAMKARLNAVIARRPVAKVGDIVKRRDEVLGVIEDIRNADDYYVRLNGQNNNDEYKIYHSNNFGNGISIVPPETLNANHKEKARVAIKKANNSRRAQRKANIRARQIARGLTPGGISFNPVAIAQNKETHPLGPNNGFKRASPLEIVEGAFSHRKQGYTGNYNENVERPEDFLWQTPSEKTRARFSPYNKENRTVIRRLPLKSSVPLKSIVPSWLSSIFSRNTGPSETNILPPNERNTLPAYERGMKLHDEELHREGTSGGRRVTRRKQSRNRKQKTKKQRKSRK